MESNLSLRSSLMLQGIFHFMNGFPDSAIKCHPVNDFLNSRVRKLFGGKAWPGHSSNRELEVEQ